MKLPIEPFQIEIIKNALANWIAVTEEVGLAKALTDEAIAANTDEQFNDAVDRCEEHEIETIALEARTRGELLGLLTMFDLKLV
jgi:hypothetical protein